MFHQLDFIYLPSRDVAADLSHFTNGLGAELVFAIEAFETRVAMVRWQPVPWQPVPLHLLLAGHLEGDSPVLVYRARDLEPTVSELAMTGEVAARFEIPHGPGVELRCAGPQRVALCELVRAEAADRLNGRRDF